MMSALGGKVQLGRTLNFPHLFVDFLLSPTCFRSTVLLDLSSLHIAAYARTGAAREFAMRKTRLLGPSSSNLCSHLWPSVISGDSGYIKHISQNATGASTCFRPARQASFGQLPLKAHQSYIQALARHGTGVCRRVFTLDA